MSKNKKKIIYFVAAFLLLVITFTYQKSSAKNITASVNKVEIDSSYILVFVISAFLIFLSILLYLFIDRFQGLSAKAEHPTKKINNPIINFSVLEFKKEVFDIYKKITEGYSNKDLDLLKSVLSEDLYNRYYDNIKILDDNNITSSILDLKMEDIQIISVKDCINYYDLSVNVKLSYNIINVKDDKEVINKNTNTREDLILTFSKNKKLKDIYNCPKCYHLIENHLSNVCPHCKSIIAVNTDSLKLSKEEKVKK